MTAKLKLPTRAEWSLAAAFADSEFRTYKGDMERITEWVAYRRGVARGLAHARCNSRTKAKP